MTLQHNISTGQVDIGHPAKRKTSHLANGKIPHMADVFGEFLLYN